MKTTMYPILFALLFCCNIFAFSQVNEFSFMEEYPAVSGDQFALSTNDGFIHVYPSAGNTIKVYYIVSKGNNFMKISKTELEEKVEIEILSSSERLDIKIVQKDKYRWSEWNNRYNVSCEIYVPSKTSCYLKSSDGNIMVKDLSANQKCKTSDGDIRATNIAGDLTATTSDGDVTAENISGNIRLESSDGDLNAGNVDGDGSFSTSDGDIVLYMVTGIIEASTSDGDITFKDCAGSFSGVTSDGTIRGNLSKLNGKLSAVSSDGDISVSIPEGIGINLKMKGEDLTFPKSQISGKISEHHIQGEVNGGGFPVELITSDGDVTLSYR